MKKLFTLSLIFIGCLRTLSAQETFPVNGPRDIRPDHVAFVHATLFVDAHTKIENAVLIIRDGVVEYAGASTGIPKTARVVDLQGKFIYPSFIDLYGNYGINWVPVLAQRAGRSQQFVSNKKGAFGWNEAIRAEQNAADVFSYEKNKSKQLLESGFGVTLTQITDGVCRGTAALVSTGEGKDQELMIDTKAAAAFSFNKGSSTQDYPSSLMGAIALLRQTHYDAF